jgi:hypothetical protein
MFILRLVHALQEFDVRYAIAGGYAVALHGAVRGTVDIDLVVTISEASLTRLERALSSLGLQSRLPVSAADIFRFRDEYISNRNLIAWSFWNPNNPIELVDVIITHDLSAMASTEMLLQGVRVKVLAINDLIAMKRTSGRPQDLEDIRALERL